MSNSIQMFNTGLEALHVTVNNGNQLTLAAANSSTYIPSSFSEDDMPKLNRRGTENGEFHRGSNNVTLSLLTSSETNKVSIKIPDDIGPTDSYVIYIFWKSYEKVSWMLLNSNGKPISGSLSVE